MKKLTSVRMSEFTRNQLDRLVAHFGASQAQIIFIAIDRLYAATFPKTGGDDESN